MYLESKDTIAAISTPLGQSGVGVIRLSGPKAITIADSLFDPSGKLRLSAASSHTLHHGLIKNDNKVIDEVVISIFKNPHSYTGEDIIEISAHGGPVILKEILGLCLLKGARLAGPGEFTFRAFSNGKMDLAKAEAVADLIASKAPRSARASVNQLRGSLSDKILAWRQEILELLAKIEASLDHTEEDIQFLTAKEVKTSLDSLLAQIQALKNSAAKGKQLREGLKVAIIGKPNAGKSSLLNALLEKDRAIVTEYPGTTRDTIEESLDLKGIPVVITDTAGLRESTVDPIEKIGQERAYACIKNADLVLWVLDLSGKLTGEDRHIASLLRLLNIQDKIIPVLNKCDLHQVLDEKELTGLFPSRAIKVSALKRSNFDRIEEAVLAHFIKDNNLADEPFLINERHVEALRSAEEALRNTLISINKKETEEVVAFNLREALNYLGYIAGENVSEEVLEKIFSKFCIGK